MTDPTPLDLGAIQARADAATPGPWHGPHDGLSTCVRQGDYGWVAPGPGPEYDSDTEQGINDAEFIAHARTDVPALLDALAAARAEMATAASYAEMLEGAGKQLADQRDEALNVLRKFVDPDPCRFDHNGYCQAHFLDEAPCPVAEARRLTASEPTS